MKECIILKQKINYPQQHMQRQCTLDKEKTSALYSEEYGFLGHLLYSERLIQRISIETVAIELNLSSYIIKNLETGYLDRPPGLSYMLGFLRTYAFYLGLNGKELTNYATSNKEAIFEEEYILKTPFQQNQLPSKSIIWGSVLALSVTIAGYLCLESFHTAMSDPHSIAYFNNVTDPNND